MLDHLGEDAAAKHVMAAIETATIQGIGTRPGQHSTDQITAAILSALEAPE